MAAVLRMLFATDLAINLDRPDGRRVAGRRL